MRAGMGVAGMACRQGGGQDNGSHGLCQGMDGLRPAAG
jgi:hypothetical protein